MARTLNTRGGATLLMARTECDHMLTATITHGTVVGQSAGLTRDLPLEPFHHVPTSTQSRSQSMPSTPTPRTHVRSNCAPSALHGKVHALERQLDEFREMAESGFELKRALEDTQADLTRVGGGVVPPSLRPSLPACVHACVCLRPSLPACVHACVRA